MIVTYHCGGAKFTEAVCVEHKGYAKHKADHWVKYRGGDKCKTAEDFMNQKDILSVPNRIQVQKKGNYKIIKDANF